VQLLRLSRYPESAKSVIRERMEEFTAYDLLNRFVTRHWKDEASLGEALKSHVDWRTAPNVRVYTDDLLTPAQAVDVVWCWGWIDGIRKGYDRCRFSSDSRREDRRALGAESIDVVGVSVVTSSSARKRRPPDVEQLPVKIR
jgi:hypothetical protein